MVSGATLALVLGLLTAASLVAEHGFLGSQAQQLWLTGPECVRASVAAARGPTVLVTLGL